VPEISSILRLEVPVIVRLGQRTMSMKEVLSLVPGAIIELPKNAEEELDLLVNNKQIGLGTAVKVVENFGIRISYIGDLKARIEALGGGLGGGLQPSGADADAAAA
jgi:flagellar motor switch protein FliN